jgi:hypothetical protein
MDACINAIERFSSQYADVTKEFYSDNGTNFEGVDNALKRMYDRNTRQEIERYFRQRRVSWHFNTPYASSQGGAWERMIRSVRRLLANLPVDPQKTPVSPDQLRTMLAGAQKILNSRPLTPIGTDPQDCDALTPSSLIHHYSTDPVNPIGTLPTRESLLINHRQVQDRVDVFWQKWMLLYTQYLQKRDVRRTRKRNLKVGDLVLIVDKPTPRGQYPLARVTRVYPDHLDCVRRVQVMTANANKLNPFSPCTQNVYDRDTTKLALLEFPQTNPEPQQGEERVDQEDSNIQEREDTQADTTTVAVIQEVQQKEDEERQIHKGTELSPHAKEYIPQGHVKEEEQDTPQLREELVDKLVNVFTEQLRVIRREVKKRKSKARNE